MSDSRLCVSITAQAKLEELADHLRASGRFAFDTEFVSEDSFEPELGLIQVATRERLATIDPLSVTSLEPFWDVINDPSVELVMHAPGEDLRICKAQTGRMPARVVDVQRGAGLIGLNYPSSLGNLLASCLRVGVDGRETRTDWLRRPLSPAQVRYALDDVRYLLDLSDHINNRLTLLGRQAWADEEYGSLPREIADREAAERWRRLSGAGQLSRRGLEATRRLWEWRRETARQTNQPVRRVMRDDILVSIAKRLPTHRTDLEALRDFNRPHLQARAGELLKIVADARAVAEAALPAMAERVDETRASGMVTNLLLAVMHRACEEHHVAVSLAGSVSDLRDLVRWNTDEPRADPPALLRGWRRDACGLLLMDVLAGRRAVRIVDVNGEMPIAIDPVSEP